MYRSSPAHHSMRQAFGLLAKRTRNLLYESSSGNFSDAKNSICSVKCAKPGSCCGSQSHPTRTCSPQRVTAKHTLFVVKCRVLNKLPYFQQLKALSLVADLLSAVLPHRRDQISPSVKGHGAVSCGVPVFSSLGNNLVLLSCQDFPCC